MTSSDYGTLSGQLPGHGRFYESQSAYAILEADGDIVEALLPTRVLLGRYEIEEREQERGRMRWVWYPAEAAL